MVSFNRFSKNFPFLRKIAIGWEKSVSWRWIFLFLFLFYFSLSSRLVPQTYNIQMNSKIAKDIKAPHQGVDEEATKQAKEKAAAQVQPVYSYVFVDAEMMLKELFAKIEELNRDDQISQDNKVDIYRTVINDLVNNYVTSPVNLKKDNPELAKEMQQVLQKQKYKIPVEVYYKLPKLSLKQISEMAPIAREIVKQLTNDPLSQADVARVKVAEKVNARSLAQPIEREMVTELVRISILPTRFFDKSATDEAKFEAEESISSVLIRQGDIVAKEGQLVTEDLYKKLQALGLLQKQKNFLPYAGVVLLASLFTWVLYAYREFIPLDPNAPNSDKHSQWGMLWCIFTLTILLLHIIAQMHSSQWSFVGYLAPVAVGSILIALLLDTSLALVCSFLFTILAGIILNVRQEYIFDFNYAFVAAVVSFTSVIMIHRASHRSSILKTGIVISLFGAVAVLALALVNPEPDRSSLLQAEIFVALNGLLTIVLVIGLMPIFETVFGILSSMKLVELANPNHPLLRRVLVETPGTYHHSLMVGNLSEAAAEAVGANGLLCRVGSFYHDVGKTKRPLYFVENQNGAVNPHDLIPPEKSAEIIKAHTTEGAELLKAYKLPKQIRDIAEQHHGTTLLKYFYFKALKEAKTAHTEIQFTEVDYRYPGPKAQSKEAAIVGIADCVEAAVRSITHPKIDEIEELINKIIKERLDDHQLNECDLTMKHLDKIAASLKETVIGMFHSRIEYPSERELKTVKMLENRVQDSTSSPSSPMETQGDFVQISSELGNFKLNKGEEE